MRGSDPSPPAEESGVIARALLRALIVELLRSGRKHRKSTSTCTMKLATALLALATVAAARVPV